MKNEMTAQQIQTLLREYEQEIFDDGVVYGRLDLEFLIISHRTLRELNIQHRTDYNTSFQQAKELGAKVGYDEVVSREYIKVQELKAMTVLELANFLAESED